MRSPFVAWLCARAIGGAGFALLLLNVAVWTGCGLSPALVRGTALGCLLLVLWRHRPLTNLEWRAIAKVEGICLMLAVVFTLAFAWNYGSAALGERRLDLGLVSSLMTMQRFPAPDFWFAGAKLDAYYFGSWTAAAVGRLAGVSPATAYFGGLVAFWVQSVLAALAAGRLLGARRLQVWLGVVTICFMGNATWLLLWFRGLPPWDARTLFASSRIIPGTINENPGFAFWGAELHAHVMVMPCLMLFCGAVWHSMRRGSPGTAGLASFLAAVIAMTDAWMVIPGALAAVLMAVGFRRGMGWIVMRTGLPVMLGAVVFALPFLRHYGGYPLRVLWVGNSSTSFAAILALFGPLLVLLIIALLAKPDLKWLTASPGMPLVVAAVLLVAMCEFLYIDNGYPPPGERQNSVFRFHFAAWILLGLGITVLQAGRLPSRSWSRHLGWVVVLVSCLAGQWPALASLGARGALPSLDMRKALDPERSGLLEVSDWLVANTSPETIIMESAGAAYKGYATVSALSGRTAVLGETDKVANHGHSVDSIKSRLDEVYQVYLNLPVSNEILEKYHVNYIVLGPAEERAFPNCRTREMLSKYEVVTKSGGTHLLRVPSK
ncbi:MAG: hypothetical protein K1X53_12720 [Candidatus Sumerlaeaceae bacterium]|nr:hypothetical protein [Candidatus Sumerlaeaceae bacterium]